MLKVSQDFDNKAQNHANILGVDVVSTSASSVLRNVRYLISHNLKFYIVTPNPELILMAGRGRELLKIVNSANFTIPDGSGLKYASFFLYGKTINIIPGRKLFLDLIGLANKQAWRVFFLGGEHKEAKLAAGKLAISYKRVKIESFPGPQLDNQGKPVLENDRLIEIDAIKKINDFRPQLLFVAFGMPKQEMWIYKNLKKLDIGGAMAVGGTFRYIAGLSKLPPSWMEKLGLEWLWRLITEPWRAGRILNAALLFPIKVFWYKFKTPSKT